MGFWHLGQEVKLAPLFLIFSNKFSKMVDPKQRKVSFKSGKKRKKRKRGHQFLLSAKLYTHFINYFKLFYDFRQIRAEWLVYYLLYQVNFSTPLKWHPGHMPPKLASLRYATGVVNMLSTVNNSTYTVTVQSPSSHSV